MAWYSGFAPRLFVVLALSLSVARAADVPDKQARAVRAVVGAQLQAMTDDDAARAFSYASPSIRKMFGDATTFMAMVRQSYPMVIHPASVSYLLPQAQGPSVMQAVLLRDQDGQTWLAVYELQQQKDGSWRIEGCVVRADDGKSST